MKLLIDARPLVDPHSGGVQRVGVGLIEALCNEASSDEITLLTTGASKREIPFSIPQNTKHHHVERRNKMLSASMMLGAPIESYLPEKYDVLFFPNLGFTGPLNTPYIVLIHDLSFLIEPKWFSFKDRVWHKAVNPKTMIKNAKSIFTVSKQTKIDLEKLTGRKHAVHVLPMAHTPLKEAVAKTAERPYFFAFGSNDKRKNTACLIEAMDELRKDYDVNLLVTGTETWGKPYVKALGRINDGELAEYVKGSEALLIQVGMRAMGCPYMKRLV